MILDRTVTAQDGSAHPIRAGVIGFVPPQIMQWDRTNLLGEVIAADIVATAQKYVPQMKAEGADIIVAVPHSGLSTGDDGRGAENATYDLSNVPGIDAIMFGHAHLLFPSETYAGLPGVDVEKGTLNGVPAVMPGFWGSHLGLVDLLLNVDDNGVWSVVDGTSAVRGIYERDGRDIVELVDADERIVDAVRADHEATIAFMRKGVGMAAAPIHSYFALVQDDPSIQIVTNAQKWYVERLIQGTEYDGIPVLSVGAPFKAGGRGGADYYTFIPAGEIALKHIADLYIYPNTLRAVMLDGDGVREWLEMSAGAFNKIDPNAGGEQPLLSEVFPSYNFDVIDGVGYRIDVTQEPRYGPRGELINPDSHRIAELTYNGQPIDPVQKFIVATNNYRAGGGGNFPGLDGTNIIIEAPDENRSVLGACAAEKSARRSRYRMDCGWIGGSGQYDPIRQLRLGTARCRPRIVATSRTSPCFCRRTCRSGFPRVTSLTTSATWLMHWT